MRLFVLLLALALAACGGSSSDADPKPAPAATDESGASEADHGAHDHAGETEGKEAGGAKTDEAQAAFYCPMHPEVTAEEPGQRCGKCNMFLVKPGDEHAHGD